MPKGPAIVAHCYGAVSVSVGIVAAVALLHNNTGRTPAEHSLGHSTVIPLMAIITTAIRAIMVTPLLSIRYYVHLVLGIYQQLPYADS